ncbi:MAG: DUF3793 family protein [Ruminiclostridium sp.]|nr:DUF3793 family protein [Ruminiclostridium sp.]
MSMDEYRSFCKKLAFHTAPTLLGIKCASLVSLSCSEFDLGIHLKIFNERARERGLRIRILHRCMTRCVLLVYSEKQLRKRLGEPETAAMLRNEGYDAEGGLEGMLAHLSERMSDCAFPHEIGLFLDYPAEDVKGFIENNGENYKLCGCWKVYGSEERAKRTFEDYEKCRTFLCNKLNEGWDMYRALRIS